MNSSSSLLLNDFSGHAFTLQLARQLRDNGWDVTYTFCADNPSTPHGDFDREDFVEPIDLGRPFRKYRVRYRVWDELRYGVSAGLQARRSGAMNVLAANMPVISLAVIWLLMGRRQHKVLWLQDLQGSLVDAKERRLILRLPVRAYILLERFVVRAADQIVTIAESLAAEVQGMGVVAEDVTVVENWGVIEAIPRLEPNLALRAELGIGQEFLFVYSGTLGIKHRPELLLALAERAAGRGHVLVISEGPGADWLTERPHESLTVVPYRPFDQLAETLAVADAFVVLLEEIAESLSVPSKVLSYLCAGRPIVGSVPDGNPVTEVVNERARCGRVVADGDAFIDAALDLIGSPELRSLGDAARAYAEVAFDIEKVSKEFEAVLQ